MRKPYWMQYILPSFVTVIGLAGYIAVRGFGWVPKPDELAGVVFIAVTLIGFRLILMTADWR